MMALKLTLDRGEFIPKSEGEACRCQPFVAGHICSHLELSESGVTRSGSRGWTLEVCDYCSCGILKWPRWGHRASGILETILVIIRSVFGRRNLYELFRVSPLGVDPARYP